MLSEVFAILGSILISIKLQYQFIDFRNRKDYKISLLEEKPLSELKQESIRILKPIFEKLNNGKSKLKTKSIFILFIFLSPFL